MVNTPIPNLKIFGYLSVRGAEEDAELIALIASSYRNLTDCYVESKLESSASLLKIVDSCRDLNSLAFDNDGGDMD
jgi:hypothetical protein